ncbi:MAG: hypothetical protein P4L65_03315 [Legionella sp.]|nr:hypothetical protein [Legionella sp.]
MSLKNDEDSSIKPGELVFLLAIAGRIDAQCKTCATKLHNNRQIYHAYAVLDSLSSSYSMFKYFFEVFISNSNDLDLMHEIMTSPEGIAAITAEVLFLVGFSFLASYFDEDDNEKNKNNGAQQFIVDAWPYVRDVMKGLKNAYKGWRGTVQVMSLLSGANLKYLIVPVGLVLGVLAAANRFWLRSVREERKTMKRANSTLLKQIRESTKLSGTDTDIYRDRIQRGDPSSRKHIYALWAAGIGGLIDGMYLYMGVMSLALLPTPAFIAMVAISIFYTVACIISRVYEEYDYQLDLEMTQTKCELAVISKTLELNYAELLVLQEKEDKQPDDMTDIMRLQKNIKRFLGDFDALRTLLKSQSTHSYLTASLLGIKAGLFAYGVLAGLLFMVVSVFLISAAVFPPALLIACIVSGLVLMMAVTAYSTRTHYLHLKNQKKDEDEPYAKIQHIMDEFNNELTQDEFKAALKNGASPEASPKFALQEWCEVFRSFFSGISKGNNFATFVETPFMDNDGADHAHDSPVTGMLAFGSAALFSIVLALRALARGLGRDDPSGAKETQVVQGAQDTHPEDARPATTIFGFFATARPLLRTPSRLRSSDPTPVVIPHVQSSAVLESISLFQSSPSPAAIVRASSSPSISSSPALMFF